MAFTYKYARPALTADCVIFGLNDDDLKVLLIQRKFDPFAGLWAFPGGFANVGESLEHTARRELEEETGIKNLALEQLHTFSDPDRDPREHVVTVVYYALVNLYEHNLQASSDASDAEWFEIHNIPHLAFDHDLILKLACERLYETIRYRPIGFDLLPPKFTLRQLRNMYEKILYRKLDKSNFRKKILQTGIIEKLDEIETGVTHRPARLYRFDKKRYDRMVEKGFNFDI